MANSTFVNQQSWFIGGSNPSVFTEISNSRTVNYLLVDGAMPPSHGKGESLKLFPDNIDKIYKSNKDGKVYLIANENGYSFDSTKVVSDLFTISKTINNIDFFENDNNQIGITTGSAYYVYDDKTGGLNLVTAADGLLINNPVSCAVIDTIGFIGDGVTSNVQATKPNNARDLTNAQTFVFETVAGNLMKLGVVNRTLFFIANNGVERWVVVGGDQLLQRDNVYFEDSGLYDSKSFVNKLNMIAGIFTTKYSGIDVVVMTKETERFESLTNGKNGIVKKILASGPVTNSDIYKVDNIIYYEICFKGSSFIYSFQSKEWTETTSPMQQVVAFDNNYYCSLDKNLYPVTLYSNTEVKVRETDPQFGSQNMRLFTVGQLNLWFNNQSLEKGNVRLWGVLDGVRETVEYNYNIDELNRYSNISRHYGANCFQFSLIVETSANIIWRAISSEVQING